MTSELYDAIDTLAWFPGRCKVARPSPTASRVVRAMSHPPYIGCHRIFDRSRVVESGRESEAAAAGVAVLVRINPRDPAVPPGHLSLAMTVAEAAKRIAAALVEIG